MPAAYQGTTSTNPAPGTWAATTSYSTGDLVQPSTPTGQYFQCQQNGNSGGSEPAWSNPASLPVPGTTFPDGFTQWICMGSFIAPDGAGGVTIVIDVPLDTDSATTPFVVRGMKNLANYFVGLFSLPHGWLDVQNFENGINCEDNGSNGTAGSFTGKNGTNDPGIDSTGGSTGIGVIANGGGVFGDGIWGVGQAGNSHGGRFFGFGSGSGGDFAGGSGGGDGVTSVGGAGGNGGTFRAGSGGFGIACFGASSVGGSIAGIFHGTQVGAGASFSSDSGVGAEFINSDDGAGAALFIVPSASLPTAPAEGGVAYNGTTHHLEYYNGSTWVVL